MENDFIKIEKLKIDDKEMCQIEMYGHNYELTSIIFSCMKTNDKFAAIILDAAEAFTQSSSRESFLN